MQKTDRKGPVAATRSRGTGPAWPTPEAGLDDGDSNVTARLDPSDPELRAWFVAESRRLQADRVRLGLLVPEQQRSVPDATLVASDNEAAHPSATRTKRSGRGR